MLLGRKFEERQTKSVRKIEGKGNVVREKVGGRTDEACHVVSEKVRRKGSCC
jgi:hypothetical protein